MAKIFVITKGSYSDYSIVGMFSTKEKAQQALDVLSIYDKNDNIEEYELDELDTLTKKFKRGYRIYRVEMDRDGNVKDDIEVTNDIDTWINKNQQRGMLWGNVLAKNEQQAVKIMNDRRTQFIASGEL